MAKKGTLGRFVEAFFVKHLSQERGCSGNTIGSYATCLALLFKFCCKHLKKSIDRLVLGDIDADLVLAFLNHLEIERENKPQTRNVRLACIHTFFRFVALEDATMLKVCQRICAIKPKRVADRVRSALTHEQMDAILAAVEPNNLWGFRDHALLLLLYNTGARVSEIVDLEIDDLRLEAPYLVSLTGKGNKQRYVLLWEETVVSIKRYLDARNRRYDQIKLILNTKGRPISRFGIGHIVEKYHQLAQPKCPSLREINVTPHTLRHTYALHNAEAGNAITDIRDNLGHTCTETTRIYFKMSMKMKQKALDAVAPPPHASSRDFFPLRDKPDILDLLDTLCHPTGAGTRTRPRSGPH